MRIKQCLILLSVETAIEAEARTMLIVTMEYGMRMD
jgi:hypothetical protein